MTTTELIEHLQQTVAGRIGGFAVTPKLDQGDWFNCWLEGSKLCLGGGSNLADYATTKKFILDDPQSEQAIADYVNGTGNGFQVPPTWMTAQ